MTELEVIKNHLRTALLHINGELNREDTTKSFVFISSLNFAKNNTEKALDQIAWLENNPSIEGSKE